MIAPHEIFQLNVTNIILTLWKHSAWDPFQTDQLVVNEPNDDASSQQDSPTEEKFNLRLFQIIFQLNLQS